MEDEDDILESLACGISAGEDACSAIEDEVGDLKGVHKITATMMATTLVMVQTAKLVQRVSKKDPRETLLKMMEGALANFPEKPVRLKVEVKPKPPGYKSPWSL